MVKSITLDLPEIDMQFMEDYAVKHGMSVSEAFDRIVAFLRRTEQRPLHPDVLSLVGILKNTDPDSARMEYLRAKHL